MNGPMPKVRYSYVNEFVILPEKLRVLLLDVQAADSNLEETIDLAEELHRDLGHWLDDLHGERKTVREEAARKARKQARAAERRAARRAA